MVSIPFVGDIIKEVGETVRQAIPDADKRMEIEAQLQTLEYELLQGQLEVNKQEAASASLFVAGWRPFIGWTCGGALAYTWIVAPVMKVTFKLVELPIIDPSQIYPIVTAMLGVAGMRTYEKVKGVATSLAPPAPKETPKKGWFR
jgi:hypothetical protein